MAKPNARVAFVQINPEMEDSVIIEKPESEKATETAGEPAKEKTQEPETSVKEKGEEEEEKEDDDDAESVDNSDSDGEPRYPRRGRICYNNRDYSPRRPRSLVDTKSLNKLLKLNDVCAETVNDLMIYIVNHPFHAGDLENISWVFKMGVSDTWVKKPMSQKDRERVDSEERGRGRYYDDRYDRYDDYEGPGPREMIRRTTIARLGNALKVFKSDEKKYGTENVKFVIVVKGRGNGGCMKLRVAHSRQAAMAEIFHEMLNRYEIVFVGAILQEVIVPMDRKDKAATFQRVASLKEAQELAGPVVGVIC